MLALLARITTATVGDTDPLVLFVDFSQITRHDPRLTLRMNPPTKGPRIISPTEPWESWAVFAYNSVVAGDGERPHRMYYDCIEGTGVPPGAAAKANDPISHRRICLAESLDGVEWTKPRLGVFVRNGTSANNIMVEDSGVSVFIDPSAAADARWKMVCSQAAYASADGVRWRRLPWKTVAEDDTKPTARYDVA